MNYATIAIIGAGTMGAHLAMDLGSCGHQVILKDKEEAPLLAAEKRMKGDFRMFQMMRKDWKQKDLAEILSHIQFTTSYQHWEHVNLIIENIPEDVVLKQQLYQQLAAIADKDVIYAVNTSCISITKVASWLPDPSKVIGTHFLNPVPLKELVEVIKGYHTSAATIDFMRVFLRSIGKLPVLVNDATGFVANRLSHLFMNEAAFLVQEGVATPEDIDIIFRKGYGHAMGPLETADLIGLDTVLHSLRILYDSYQDPKFRSCPLLEKMVAAGQLGKKTGAGFYKY
ncbi:3-hydroxyacyl-CoA dehydrogenase family protein [Chitinophaga polysaccharea]|uniref:3-hydroxyacyl-CoA dehydrogenase family protein n=1 Tax=Chitinophaga TaxID=79328 RepID=UPI00145505F4|nr:MULTISPECIES: 3-hydroxyacyl-CoA dehydrogenase family protein [Chitinophaga]NLR57666.1 3-hydroxyacyl-CoA dehydrogenase family protein [Chitinophaga polysaccharea]NLU93258.1 3-hydroxyacyl-CoA dehydrogenase family protein [Chitinophaga sp. Ak27]